MILGAIYSMQKFMSYHEKVVICTTDDRKIKVSKKDTVFAEGKFLMIKTDSKLKAVNSDHVTYMFIKECGKSQSSLSKGALEKIRNTVEEGLA